MATLSLSLRMAARTSAGTWKGAERSANIPMLPNRECCSRLSRCVLKWDGSSLEGRRVGGGMAGEAFDDRGCDVADLHVAILRCSPEDAERGVSGAMVLAHQHAEGLVDG